MKKISTLTIVLIVASLTLAACGGADPTPDRTPPEYEPYPTPAPLIAGEGYYDWVFETRSNVPVSTTVHYTSGVQGDVDATLITFEVVSGDPDLPVFKTTVKSAEEFHLPNNSYTTFNLGVRIWVDGKECEVKGRRFTCLVAP